CRGARAFPGIMAWALALMSPRCTYPTGPHAPLVASNHDANHRYPIGGPRGRRAGYAPALGSPVRGPFAQPSAWLRRARADDGGVRPGGHGLELHPDRRRWLGRAGRAGPDLLLALRPLTGPVRLGAEGPPSEPVG